MSSPTIRVVLPLAEALRNRRAGGKAASLARLVEAGFSVPRGFVISADAYRSHLWSSGAREIASGQPEAEQREAIRAAILAQPIPEDVWLAVSEAYERLSWQTGIPDPKVAVRSSALEDSRDGAGFAGAYESYLNISGTAALDAAIKRVWASLWSGKAAAFRARFGSSGEPAMAVIVQQMVEAEVSGSAFTANPVTGDPTGVSVNVHDDSGLIHQFRVKLRDFGVTEAARDKREDCDPAGEVDQSGYGTLAKAVAEKAILIEDAIGGRVDVEWAADRDGLWILQAGSISDLPPYFPVDCVEAALVRQDARPLSHFARSIVRPSSGRVLNGYLYRANDAESANAARGLNQWHGCVRPELTKRASGVIHADRALLNDQALAEALRLQSRDAAAACEWLARGKRAASDSIGSLGQVVDDRAALRRLLGGISGVAVERDALLQELAERFAVGERSGKLEDEKWWREYKADVEKFAGYYGYAFRDTGEAVDLSRWRSWIEDLDSVFRMVNAMSKRGQRPTLVTLQSAAEQDSQAAEEEAMAALPKSRQAQLKRVLESARRWIRARGDIEHACTLAATALRLLLMERAERMVRADLVASRDDVLHLSLTELLDASDRAGLAGLIARRKHEFWLESRLNAPERLPADEAVETQDCCDTPGGVGASPGVASGRARVAKSIEEAAEIENGEILVTSSPSSAWTPFLAIAGGLVCEIGDDFSDAAVAARTYRIPAVVGCRGAMTSIADGRRITFDGGAGELRL